MPMEKRVLANLVDEAYADMIEANAAVPYDGDAYDAARRVFEAACMVYAAGDTRYAEGLQFLFDDSGESVHWYTTAMSADEIRGYGD